MRNFYESQEGICIYFSLVFLAFSIGMKVDLCPTVYFNIQQFFGSTLISNNLFFRNIILCVHEMYLYFLHVFNTLVLLKELLDSLLVAQVMLGFYLNFVC